MKPTISVVVPIYNNAATIETTLDSVLMLESVEDVELVISDDASTDATVSICRRWMRDHGKRFRRALLLENKTNLGISGNHKAAFAAATSDYGLYLGGDDYFYDSRFLVHVRKYLQRYPETRIAKTRVESLNSENGKVVDIYRYKRLFFSLAPQRQLACLAVLGNFLYAGPGTVVKISEVGELDAFDANCRSFEDLPLLYAFLEKGHRIRFVDAKGLYWLRHKGSLSYKGFGAMQGQFSADLDYVRKRFVHPNITRFSAFERLLLRSRKGPKLIRQILLLTYWEWYVMRLLPSLQRRFHAMSRKKPGPPPREARTGLTPQ
jgi:alpha-1,3-rhamnosyltransferase